MLPLANDRDAAVDVQFIPLHLHLGFVNLIFYRVPDRTFGVSSIAMILHVFDDEFAEIRVIRVFARLGQRLADDATSR